MTIEALKNAITGLPQDAQVALASWLNLQTMDAWDREMQNDSSPGGRGYHLVESVKNQIRAGMFRPMSEGSSGKDE
ncbi:MAG TPA: hypothetical protein VKT81_19440 [Bryobacteraceae bacterium]|nr:hypothetical protein [Bryobacteraceae bacterium]